MTGQKSIDPDRPFFMFWGPGAVHAPHQAPDAYLKKYRGKGAFAGGCPPGEPYAVFAIVDRKDYWNADQGAEVREKFDPYHKAFNKHMLKQREKWAKEQ